MSIHVLLVAGCLTLGACATSGPTSDLGVETCVPTPGTSADDVLHGRGFCESDGPPPPADVPEHYANGFARWFWTHDGPAIVIGAALLVAIVTHKHGNTGHSTAPTTCGPGTGQVCPPLQPVCTNTVGGICLN